LNSAGVHHFIIDGPSKPSEEIVSMDAFLAGISSCATHLMEDFAEEEGIPLQRATVSIRAFRPKDEPNRFDHIDIRIELTGPTKSRPSISASASKAVDRSTARLPWQPTFVWKWCWSSHRKEKEVAARFSWPGGRRSVAR